MNVENEFLGENFLLHSEQAQRLYHSHAAKLPINDYHNHLSPKDIAEDRKFSNLTEIWLEGDHYKWRAMRSCGIAEKYCTGDCSPKEKFTQWAATVPQTLRNPLYHWTHLELKNYFGVNKPLNPTTASAIYEQCTEMLQTKEYSTRSLLKKMNVETLCTTDDPCDDLLNHSKMSDSKTIKMLPTFRPDKAYAFEDVTVYNNYLKKLSEATNIEINSIDNLLYAIEKRMDYFQQHGCKLSDHGLEKLPSNQITHAKAKVMFDLVLQKTVLPKKDIESLRLFILTHLSRSYHARGWAQQFHLGAMRNTNLRKKIELGSDTGFDSIGDFPQAKSMASFFSNLDSDDQLAKTIIYNLNPAFNEVFATMIGNFNDGTIKGKMQWGSSWWFLDQKDGIEKQLNTLSNIGLLSHFVGMVTDSRSFMSFPRHEYFRRILCQLVGDDMRKGELPNDFKMMGELIENISYLNTKNYFKF
jgi:glucuronate isomerase